MQAFVYLIGISCLIALVAVFALVLVVLGHVVSGVFRKYLGSFFAELEDKFDDWVRR